jgi:hypothetical protein
MTVIVGNGVTNISTFAFWSLPDLTGVYFRGHPPSSNSAFAFDSSLLTIYYLPNTSGWGATFDGISTGLWKPTIKMVSVGSNLQTNQFGFNIAWANGQIIVVQACSNLINQMWFPLQTNTLTSDSYYFNDSQGMNFPERFYRISSP